MEWFKNFCGIKMSSNYQTFDLISRILDDNPPHAIIEIGTYTGTLSLYLALEAIRNGDVEMFTINIEKQHNQYVDEMFDKLGVTYMQMDVFESRDELFNLFGDKPVFLLCDGGNKREEFLMCVPKLPKGSIVAVHDYSTEFLDEVWVPLAEKGLCTPIMREDWMKEDVRMAIFKI